MTIKEFHARRISKIKYEETAYPIHTIADFYDGFLKKEGRLPDPEIVKKWHDILAQYVNDETSTVFIARKYSGGKENNVWNNRRGAVIQFADGFEIVYADNFLAHEIFLMAYHGFVPTYEDFKKTIEQRELFITSGTDVEKKIRLYPSASKTCGCYLAHIVDVNGLYLREDNSYREISSAESSKLYPLGTPADWTKSADRIYHVPTILSDKEKALVKAHFIRFLDPMNHYVTPDTKHCSHTVPQWKRKKNIGEYSPLTYFVQKQYKALFGTRYDELTILGKFKCEEPTGYTDSTVIDLNIRFDLSACTSTVPTKSTAPAAGGNPKTPRFGHSSRIEYVPSDIGAFKSLFVKKGAAKITITYFDGHVETRTWTCKKITQTSNIRGNLTSQAWYRKSKDSISHIICEVL
jgi:hypothetical protein